MRKADSGGMLRPWGDRSLGQVVVEMAVPREDSVYRSKAVHLRESTKDHSWALLATGVTANRPHWEETKAEAFAAMHFSEDQLLPTLCSAADRCATVMRDHQTKQSCSAKHFGHD